VLSFFPNVRSSTPGAFVPAVGAVPTPGYRLRCLRGRGGFAEVWESDSPAGPVALKFMPSSNTGSTARELRSVHSFRNLEHPYLVKTHGTWTVPGYIVVSMELAEATLLDLLTLYHNDLHQPFDPQVLCLYLWQVAEALDHLNGHTHLRDGRKVGFQHGDVKPNNILLFGDVAKLTDYGLATSMHMNSVPCSRQGTRDYAGPEVFCGTMTDWSDQYSLAVTYYALRAGALPFPPAGKPENTARSTVRPLADLSGATEPERSPLLRALSPIPSNRFGTCREFMAAMLAALRLRVEHAPDGKVRVVKEAAKSYSGSGAIARPASAVGIFDTPK
jgi:serine/threonine protein kinase